MPQTAEGLEIGAGRNVARHFDAVPSLSRSLALLEEIAHTTPNFATVPRDMPLALYGAGNLGRMARDFLKAVWLDFDFVVDRNAAALRDSPDWRGMAIYHPDEVPETLKQSHLLLVSVVLAPYAPIEAELTERGFGHVVPFYDFAENFRHVHPLSNGWYASVFDNNDRAMTQFALEGWGDDISRAHHLSFLAWRRLRQEWSFDSAPVTTGDRFFIPEIVSILHGHETFLDAGAHHGSVTQRFSDIVKGRWQRIVAIEPDEANGAMLARFISDAWPNSMPRRPEQLSPVLGAANGTALFHDGLGYASQVSQTGRVDAEMRPIDGIGIVPTFIKLHLEGYELEALKGARRTLLEHRPIVAATVYHNDDGIWRTPLWLMKTLKDYRLLFRLHSYCGTSAVIYAIPAERVRA